MKNETIVVETIDTVSKTIYCKDASGNATLMLDIQMKFGKDLPEDIMDHVQLELTDLYFDVVSKLRDREQSA